MSKILREKLQQAVTRTNDCACSHAGSFFVNAQVDGQRKTLTVEVFNLQGNTDASHAFVWPWNDKQERGYIAVLGVPSHDSPQKAVQAAMEGREKVSSGFTENVCGLLPGSHMKVIPCTPEMKVACDFEFLDCYTVFRPAGVMSFLEAVSLVAEGLSFSTFLSFDRLLVDAVQLTGFPSPKYWERFWMASEWAAVGKGLRLAVIARPELIEPGHFGVAVARDRGLYANVFTAEPEAVDWLLKTP